VSRRSTFWEKVGDGHKEFCFNFNAGDFLFVEPPFAMPWIFF
jgi:hypothetical protein